MAKPTEQRILEWLNQFDDSLQNAWDVPRDNSLPGIADAIGVVRSALHKPLKSLQNKELIIVKQAHVINGGSRKRNVHFITNKGRDSCNEIENLIHKTTIYGNPPNNIKLIGRKRELDEIEQKLSEENYVFISGIAGIGKTAITRYFVENKLKKGIKVRWYSATIISSPKTMVETWLGLNKLSSNIEDLFTVMKSEALNQILVIDNFDQIKNRFKKDFLELIIKLSSLNLKIIVTSRPPVLKNFNQILEIKGLDKKASEQLLDGFEKLEIKKIIEYFDGHPLCLIMTKKEMSLESTIKDIDIFFQKEILGPLSDEHLSALHELAIQPEPIEIKLLSFKDYIADLDDLSLITYYNNKIQLHNFVKNLLISKLNEKERKVLHSIFARNLSKFKSNKSTFLRLFHEIKSEDRINESWIKETGVSICTEFPSKSSALFHEQINKFDSDGEYYWYAAISECELGNGEIAKKLFDNAQKFGVLEKRKTDALKLNCRISRLNGEIEKAEEIIKKIEFKTELEKTQYLIGETSRKIDDRIPNQIPNKNSILILNQINLNSLNIDEKRSCLIAIAIIKHTFSLYNKEYKKAEELRTELIKLSSNTSEIIKEMEWKHSIISGKNTDFKTKNNLRNIGLICWELEFGNSNKSKLLLKLKATIKNNPELEKRPAGRRAIAQYWTWKGILDESRRAFAWTQAIGRWASSECYEASKTLQDMLQKWLKETGRA